MLHIEIHGFTPTAAGNAITVLSSWLSGSPYADEFGISEGPLVYDLKGRQKRFLRIWADSSNGEAVEDTERRLKPLGYTIMVTHYAHFTPSPVLDDAMDQNNLSSSDSPHDADKSPNRSPSTRLG